MRKALTIFIAFVLIFSSVTCMAAANEVSVVTDSAKSSINVRGTLNATRANSNVMLCFKDATGANVFVDFTKSKFDEYACDLPKGLN